MVGFVSLERCDISFTEGILRKVSYSEESVYWKVAMSPNEVWDDGFVKLQDITDDLNSGKFLYKNVNYKVMWFSKDLGKLLDKWIFD